MTEMEATRFQKIGVAPTLERASIIRLFRIASRKTWSSSPLSGPHGLKYQWSNSLPSNELIEVIRR